MNLKVYRIRENAKLPIRAHKQDAGADIFYCPTGKILQPFGKKEDQYDIHIPALYYKPVMIPTGIKISVPENHMIEVKNKSGIATKKNLIVGACVIDSGYDSEIFVNLHNIGNEIQIIKPGQKIAQIVLIPIINCGFTEWFQDNLNDDIDSERGNNGFGSTGEF